MGSQHSQKAEHPFIDPVGMNQSYTSSSLFKLASVGLCRYQFDWLPPPGLTAGPLIFPVKSPPPGQLFNAKLRPPGRKNETKIPTPGHNLPSLNAKRSMTKEHNSIKAVSFQISRNCPVDNFLFS